MNCDKDRSLIIKKLKLKQFCDAHQAPRGTVRTFRNPQLWNRREIISGRNEKIYKHVGKVWVFNLFYFICMSIVPVCYVCLWPHTCLVPMQAEEGIRPRGIIVTKGCKPLCRCCGPNPGPCKSRKYLTIEPSLQLTFPQEIKYTLIVWSSNLFYRCSSRRNDSKGPDIDLHTNA